MAEITAIDAGKIILDMGCQVRDLGPCILQLEVLAPASHLHCQA